ncbi:Ig-like domain-containing protein [Priestia flexa]|uniref:Ig-like domain-containing protein n=1 Tax=Priestia flexa TaxID=86664 RepID=UPI003D2F041C
MSKKKVVTALTAGLLVSSLSMGTGYAQENNYDVSKKAIEEQAEANKKLEKNIVKPEVINAVNSDVLKSLNMPVPFSDKSAKSLQRSSVSFDNEEIVFESEPNDDFHTANTMSYGNTVIGQLLPLYDLDMYKVNVPTAGACIIAGGASSPAIELGFTVTEKDYKDNNVSYLGSEFDEEIETQVYQVSKAGTYYVPVIDFDNVDDLDDNTEEDIYILSAAFVDNVAPAKPVVNQVTNNDKVITGKAEANSTVTVNVGKNRIGYAKANASGTFSVAIPSQKVGTTLNVTAKDAAGNVSSLTYVKVASVDVTPPAKPIVNQVDDNDKVITGKAEANSTVTVNVGKNRIGYVKASSNGSFSVSIPVQKAGTTLNVTAKDAAGNVSSLSYVKVVKADVTPPAKPTVNKVKETDKVVTGKAEANSTVTVNVGKNRLGYAKANSKGVYSVKIAAQKKGTLLNVTAKDAAGNVSKLSYVTVVKR